MKSGRNKPMVRIRRALIALFGPKFVCVFWGHAWQEDDPAAWSYDSSCQRCNKPWGEQ